MVVAGGDTSEWSVAQRQNFAALHNTNACVFIDRSENGKGPYALDFYYPHTRSPLCMHASLAAAYYMNAHNVDGYSGLVLTSLGEQVLSFTHSGNRIHISVEPAPVTTPTPDVSATATLLGCAESAIKSFAIASVGSPKLLVEITTPERLYVLRPRLDRIVSWGKASAVSGIYAYTHRQMNHYEGRNFNHLDEGLEDAATGVAAGALSVQLAQDIVLYQGAMLGNSCLISADNCGGVITIGGRVNDA